MTTKNSTLLFGTATALIALASCGAPETNNTPAAPLVPDAQEVAYTLDTATSEVDWKGTMVGVKSHTGTLHFASGELNEKGGTLAGGSFTVDMRSYTFTDTNYAKPGSAQGTKQNLMGHLMSPEFFAVDSFPTAHFTITSVEGNTATGDMTIRGHKSVEKVQNINITADGKTLQATGDLTFNRQKYGVSWNSPMKDMVLSNDIVLKIAIKGTAK